MNFDLVGQRAEIVRVGLNMNLSDDIGDASSNLVVEICYPAPGIPKWSFGKGPLNIHKNKWCFFFLKLNVFWDVARTRI